MSDDSADSKTLIVDPCKTVQPTLKRQNADDDEVQQTSTKKPKLPDDDDDSEEENRLAWIQQQLTALQENSVTTAASKDLWETPHKGLEVFTSKGVTSSEKVVFQRVIFSYDCF